MDLPIFFAGWTCVFVIESSTIFGSYAVLLLLINLYTLNGIFQTPRNKSAQKKLQASLKNKLLINGAIGLAAGLYAYDLMNTSCSTDLTAYFAFAAFMHVAINAAMYVGFKK